MDQWISGSVSDVCLSHQSDWIYHKKPIKFPVVKAHGMLEDLIPDTVENGHIYSSIKRRNYSCIGITSTFSVG